MNTGAPWLDRQEAGQRVLAMQSKLHRWAVADESRCFDDLFNLVYNVKKGTEGINNIPSVPFLLLRPLSPYDHINSTARSLSNWLKGN